jgi:hypothetical protein
MLRIVCAVLLSVGVANAQNAVMPAVSVPYADVLAMVKAGGELKVAVGVAAPAGYIRVDDAPVQVANGLWRCWRDEAGVAKMESAQAAALPKASPARPVFQYPVLPNVQSFLGTCSGGQCGRR